MSKFKIRITKTSIPEKYQVGQVIAIHTDDIHWLRLKDEVSGGEIYLKDYNNDFEIVEDENLEAKNKELSARIVELEKRLSNEKYLKEQNVSLKAEKKALLEAMTDLHRATIQELK